MSKKNQKKDEFHSVEQVEHALSEAELFIETNQKPLLIGFAIVILVVSAIIGSRYYYFNPREEKANVALFKGEAFFAKDSCNLALNGDGDFIGFLSIIEDYSGTDAANLANAYAGICYYQLGETAKALTYLKSFDADDEMVAPAILVKIGDCYTDLKKYNDAVSAFKKAAAADNNLISPIALKKAAFVYEKEQKYADALKMYTTIKNKYSNSMEGYEVDKYIDRVKVLKK